VGKTSIIRRICQDSFTERHLETVGVDYAVYEVPYMRSKVGLQLFDLSGANEYRDARVEFYDDVQGVLLMYDSSDQRSLQRCEYWIAEMERHGLRPDRAAVMLVGTRAEIGSTLTDAKSRALAAKHGFGHIKVSAKTGDGVGELVATIVARMVASVDEIPDQFIAIAEAELEKY